MKELILIPCSWQKNPKGEYSLQSRKIENDMEEVMKENLLLLRKEIARSFNIKFQYDFLMYAFKRYSGNIYKKIGNAWNFLESNKDLEVVIISALYGLIYWNEPIIDYNIKMNQKIQNHNLNTWWKKNGVADLADILDSHIKNRNYDLIRSFLSNDYTKAINNIIDKKKDNWLQYKYPYLGQGSNFYRGEDIYRILRNLDIECPTCNSRKTRRISKEENECIACKRKYKPKNLKEYY